MSLAYNFYPVALIYRKPLKKLILKVVGNKKEGGSGRWQMIGISLDHGDKCPFLF
jgi:hypothetical protein